MSLLLYFRNDRSFFKKIKKVKLLFNVSDLWPKTAVDLGIIHNKIIIRMSTFLEEWIYNNFDLISCQTIGIKKIFLKDRFKIIILVQKWL